MKYWSRKSIFELFSKNKGAVASKAKQSGSNLDAFSGLLRRQAPRSDGKIIKLIFVKIGDLVLILLLVRCIM